MTSKNTDGIDILFANYDRAVVHLAEVREILAIDPSWKPAQDRVDDALGRVANEVQNLRERILYRKTS